MERGGWVSVFSFPKLLSCSSCLDWEGKVPQREVRAVCSSEESQMGFGLWSQQGLLPSFCWVAACRSSQHLPPCLVQVWKYPKVWEGFIKCCQRTKPQSFQVILQLPPQQLGAVFDKCPELREPLLAHVRSFTPHQVPQGVKG